MIKQRRDIRFLHSVKDGNERILKGKIKEILPGGDLLIEVIDDTPKYNRISMNGTLCHRNATAIR